MMFMVCTIGLAGVFFVNGGWRTDIVVAYDSEDRFNPPDVSKLESEGAVGGGYGADVPTVLSVLDREA